MDNLDAPGNRRTDAMPLARAISESLALLASGLFAEQLLQRWGKLHAVRSALSLSSFLVFLFGVIWR